LNNRFAARKADAFKSDFQKAFALSLFQICEKASHIFAQTTSHDRIYIPASCLYW
jgi:hypothetical protein